MSQERCTLCELPLPDPPITGSDTDGRFCCEGCLQVHRLLQELEPEKEREVRESAVRTGRHDRVTGRRGGQPADAVNSPGPTPDSGEYGRTEDDGHIEAAFLAIEGMHCATCESFLCALALRQPGVAGCEASYASEMMKVKYDPRKSDPAAIAESLSRMGYRARPLSGTQRQAEGDREPPGPDQQRQEPARPAPEMEGDTGDEAVRLAIGIFFGIAGLILYSLFLYPSYLGGEGIISLTPAETRFIISNIFVMTTFVLGYTGFPILRGAWVSLSAGRPNMDLLIAVAACSAWLYSTGILMAGGEEVYFDVTMAIILAVSLGNRYEQRIRRSKHSLLAELTRRSPGRTRVRRDEGMSEVHPAELRAHDRVVVLAGERIPVDGTVVEGSGVVNEALITGESLPVTKRTGDRVYSGTVLERNTLEIDTGEEVSSTLDALVQMMWEIQSSRPGNRRLADRLAAWFVPGVLLLGLATFLWGWLDGAGATASLLAALAVLIVSCPCALGLATPLALASGMREALKRNIIFKSAAIFEGAEEPVIVAFDKTGTLTGGRMELLDSGNHPEALELAGALELYANHPVGRAVAGAEDTGSMEGSPGGAPEVRDVRTFDTGISGEIRGRTVYAGQPEWLTGRGFALAGHLENEVRNAREKGMVPVAVAWEGEIHSILAVGDRLRPEAPELLARLKSAGKKVAVVTGDSKQAAQRLRDVLDPDFLFSGARPESKTEIIRTLRSFGPVAMVGDGSNDAPALAEADCGIAIGDLTAVAADSAQIVIPEPRLDRVITAFRIVRLTRRRIRQNLAWAFLYNAVCIPLAVAGVINPLFAALAMAASSLLVVSNSARGMNLD